jgi:hypothetical protein
MCNVQYKIVLANIIRDQSTSFQQAASLPNLYDEESKVDAETKLRATASTVLTQRRLCLHSVDCAYTATASTVLTPASVSHPHS